MNVLCIQWGNRLGISLKAYQAYLTGFAVLFLKENLVTSIHVINWLNWLMCYN